MGLKLYLYATERKRDSILFLYSGRYRTFPILFSYEDNRHDILSFLNRLVLGKEKRCITTVEKNPEISRYKSDFTIEDYIRENMR